jgi:hypothetical protein
MGWTLNLGSRPEYFQRNESKWIVAQVKQMMKEKKQGLKGGAWWWIGGEFLIRQGKLVWCHRMKNYRDHAEMDVLKKLLMADA